MKYQSKETLVNDLREVLYRFSTTLSRDEYIIDTLKKVIDTLEDCCIIDKETLISNLEVGRVESPDQMLQYLNVKFAKTMCIDKRVLLPSGTGDYLKSKLFYEFIADLQKEALASHEETIGV